MRIAKASKEEIDLHKDIMTGDGLALSMLYDIYGEKIISSLKSWYPKIAAKDDTYILEAVNEAFWGYFKNPSTYDINKSTLQRFLEIAADRDLKNILKKEKKFEKKQDLPESVELEERLWNSITENDSQTDAPLIEAELSEDVNKLLSDYFRNEQDISLARLVLNGERRMEIFSEILNLKRKTIDEQRSEVKRHKDRIKKVLDRHEVEEKIKSLLR